MNPAMEPLMALAATAEPWMARFTPTSKEVTNRSTSSLPTWNMPFSMPAGTPTRRMARIIFHCSRGWNGSSTYTGRLFRVIFTPMITAAAIREVRVPSPAPAAPMSKP